MELHYFSAFAKKTGPCSPPDRITHGRMTWSWFLTVAVYIRLHEQMCLPSASLYGYDVARKDVHLRSRPFTSTSMSTWLLLEMHSRVSCAASTFQPSRDPSTGSLRCARIAANTETRCEHISPVRMQGKKPRWECLTCLDPGSSRKIPGIWLTSRCFIKEI